MSAAVFVLGSFVVDAAYRAPGLPAWGETLAGSSFVLGPGGKGSNQAVAAARAGATVTFMSAIGNDAFGELGRRTWADEGVDASLVKTATVPTGSAAILINETTGENAIIVVPGACAAMTAADVDGAAERIRSAEIFVAQLEIPLAAVERGLEIARAAGLMTVLNPAPSTPLPGHILQLVDYLIPNETEAAQLTGLPVTTLEQASAAAATLLGSGVRNVILTLGERGSLFRNAGGLTTRIPAIRPGPVVDTTGAGDAFCGAFAAGLAEGMPPREAARFASAAAGLSVTRHGTATSMAHRREIDQLLGSSD